MKSSKAFFGHRSNEHRGRSQRQTRATNAVSDATKTGTYRFPILTHFPVLDGDQWIASDEGMFCPLRHGHGRINPVIELPGV
jgi:hypothetical protein